MGRLQAKKVKSSVVYSLVPVFTPTANVFMFELLPQFPLVLKGRFYVDVEAKAKRISTKKTPMCVAYCSSL